MKIEKTTLEDILVSEGTITYTVIGKSMEPMLRQNHDIVTIIILKDFVKMRIYVCVKNTFMMHSSGLYVFFPTNSSYLSRL